MLKRVDGPSSAEEVARILADRIARRPLVTRLLSLTPVVLEQNLDAIEVFRFLRWRRIRMEKVGAEIDRVLGNSNPGGGIRALHLAQLIAAGFDPIAHPRGAAVFDHGDPEFEVFVIDMERQMRSLLTTLLTEGPHRRDP